MKSGTVLRSQGFWPWGPWNLEGKKLATLFLPTFKYNRAYWWSATNHGGWQWQSEWLCHQQKFSNHITVVAEILKYLPFKIMEVSRPTAGSLFYVSWRRAVSISQIYYFLNIELTDFGAICIFCNPKHFMFCIYKYSEKGATEFNSC